MTRTERAFHGWFTVTIAALASSCGDAREQVAASNEAPISAEAPAPSAPTASASVATVALPPKPSLLKLVKAFPDELKGAGSVYRLNGHLLVVDGARVLRVAGTKLEPVADRKGEGPFGGQTVISWIGGTYPDAVDVIAYFSNGRAPMPHVGPLTGKGEGATFGGGGGYGHIAGVGYRDGSAVIIGEDMSDRRIVTIRGKALPLTQTGRLKVGCPAEKDRNGGFLPAIDARVLGSGKEGTIVSLGAFCGGSHAGVEIWSREGEPKVIEITEWEKAFAYAGKILAGSDRIWISGASSEPILELKNLTIKALPKLGKVVNAFVGPDDSLYATDGTTIHRLVGGNESPTWQPVASFVWPTELQTVALHEGVFWGSVDGTIFKLEPGEPLAMSDGCKTPLVYLYDVKSSTEPGYSFPTTKKALQSFDRKKEISLVEFTEGNRRLGVKVPDRAAGEAVVALIQKNMKGEEPRLICHDPSKVLRTHPL